MDFTNNYKIIIVTSGQPSANPRLMKEAISLINNGFSLKIIWCPISSWADKFDEDVFRKYSLITWIQAGFHYKRQKYGYYYARIRQKVWQIVYFVFGNIFDAAIKSHVLFSQELSAAAKKYKADLYIGHNLGSLPAIVKASKKYKAKSIFDFEDFHRGENPENTIHFNLVKDVEDYYISFVDNFTTASFAISDSYKKIFSNKKFTTINNCFPSSYARESYTIVFNCQLKLFWFSQHIGKKRGLETVLFAMAKFPDNNISLTLMGNVSDEIKSYFLAILDSLKLPKSCLKFLGPVSENQITTIASKYHIGLCAEYVHIQNRDLCLTNKLFLYILAGNAILMTDTKAQKYFLAENSNIGLLYKQEDPNSLANALKFYIDNPDILMEHRLNAFQLALNKYNWEKEETDLLENIKQTFIS